MPYVLSHGVSPHGTDWINESAAECYLPLLSVLERLENEGIRPRWTVNITPILAEQLEDPAFKDGFEEYCQQKIDIAVADQARFNREGPLWMLGLAAFWQRFYTKALVQFKHQWGRSIIEGFRYFQDNGSIEIITSGATHGFQPLLGTDESCQAQIRLGVQTYQKHFKRKPRGIWLPECAYRPRYAWKSPIEPNSVPWDRAGTDEIVAQEGLEYFFIDSHMIRGGEPLGTYAANFPQLAEMFARSSKYFTPQEEVRSEYEHYLLASGATVFARDPETTVKVWSGESGYPGEEHYLEFHKQQYPGRLKYWRISQDKADLGKKQPYDPYAAFERIQDHADDLVRVVKGALARYRGQSERNGTLVAMYDTELFGHWWWEGPEFLYEFTRRLYADGSIEMVSGSDVLDTEPAKHLIHLPEGSWGEGGYHYIWINDANFWTWNRLYPAQRRLRTMAKMYANGPAHELTVQAARELLLAESSDWQFLISTFSAKEYSEVRFKDHLDRFDRLADTADRVHGGSKLSVEDSQFLKECQQKDSPFPDIDLSLWEPRPATSSTLF